MGDLKDGTLMAPGNRILVGAALSVILLGTISQAQSLARMSTEERQQYRQKDVDTLLPVPDGSLRMAEEDKCPAPGLQLIAGAQ